MKTLDRYVVRSFLYSYALWFFVLMGLRGVVDLFVNIDEFAKLDLPALELVAYVGQYYLYQSILYFQELNGLIVVLAAAFALARMNQTNELTAILASGVSLHRVILPVLVGGMLLSGLSVLNQELVIPRVKHRLVRDRDDVPGTALFGVWLVNDGRRAIWWSPQFDPARAEMALPMVFVRDGRYKAIAKLTGQAARFAGDGQWVFTDAAVAMADRSSATTERVRTYLTPAELAPGQVVRDEAGQLEIFAQDIDGPSGRLIRPTFRILTEVPLEGQPTPPAVVAVIEADSALYDPQPHQDDPQYLLQGGRLLFTSDLTPAELSLRQESGWLELMGTGELDDLLRTGKVTNPATVEVLRHTRFTGPLANLLMLLVGLPFILSRERNIKASAMLAVTAVGACYIGVYGFRYLGDFVLSPMLAAWLPILIFGPIAALMLDSIKT